MTGTTAGGLQNKINNRRQSLGQCEHNLEANAYASRVMIDNMATDDAQEGMDAFLQRQASSCHTG